MADMTQHKHPLSLGMLERLDLTRQKYLIKNQVVLGYDSINRREC